MWCIDKKKNSTMGWLLLCLVLILFPLGTPSGNRIFESLCSSAVGRAALTARALSQECVRVYCPSPLRKAMGWWAHLPFGDCFAMLIKRGTQRSSLEEERAQKGPVISYDRYMTSDRLRTRKGVGKKELGAETTKALRRNSLDKYENLSLAFRTRHGLGLSATAEEAQRLVLNSLDDEGDSEIESNDEEEESVDSEVVWWEEQQRLRKRRKKMDSSKRGMSFPIRRLGSVLIRRQKRYWMKQPPSLSLVDDSDLESEEGETQFGESSMENSFHDSSGLEPEEEEERFAHDFSTVPAYSNNGYQYENRIGNNRCDNDLDSDELDIKENGSDEWVENDDDYEWNIGDFKVTDTCLEAKRNFQDGEDEWLLLDRWDQQEEDKFDDIGVRDWSDDDETVKNEEIDPVVKMNIMPIKKQQQKGYSNGDDPHHYHNRSNSLCIHHQHGSGGGGGGIQRNHAHSNNSQKNLFRLLKNGRNLNGGEALWFEEDESEGSGGVWDRNDDGYDGENDVYSSSSSTEVEEEDDIWNDSEEDDEEYESSVVYEEEIDEEQ